MTTGPDTARSAFSTRLPVAGVCRSAAKLAASIQPGCFVLALGRRQPLNGGFHVSLTPLPADARDGGRLSGAARRSRWHRLRRDRAAAQQRRHVAATEQRRHLREGEERLACPRG